MREGDISTCLFFLQMLRIERILTRSFETFRPPSSTRAIFSSISSIFRKISAEISASLPKEESLTSIFCMSLNCKVNDRFLKYEESHCSLKYLTLLSKLVKTLTLWLLIETCSLGRMEDEEEEGAIRRHTDGLKGLSFAFKEFEMFPPIRCLYS